MIQEKKVVNSDVESARRRVVHDPLPLGDVDHD